MKRKNYISWDEYFMAVAILASNRSKDPSTTVGSCIVNKDNKIISTGYNGSPTGYDDDNMPWDREGSFENTKYAYVCHSELNAILNSPSPLTDCRLYVTLFPCNECAKAIVQAGIKEVIYMDNKYKDTEGVKVSKKILETCNVKCREYKKTNRKLEIEL